VQFHAASLSKKTRNLAGVVWGPSGHKPSNVDDRYRNFTEKQMTDAFVIVPKNGPVLAPQQTVETGPGVSY
jgi:hypothetical protein